MTILQRLGEQVTSIETQRRAREFIHVTRIRAICADRTNAASYAEANGFLPNIVKALQPNLKAAVSPMTTGNSAPLSEYDHMVAAFVETLRSVGAFDRMLPDMRRVPLRTRAVVTTLGITAAIVGEGKPSPISKLELEAAGLAEHKAVAIVAATNELLKIGGGPVIDLFERELRGAIAAVTDTRFIANITTGLSPIASSGESAAAIRADAAAAYAQIATSALSRLYWLMDSDTAKALTAKATTDGAAAFPEMTPQGGIFVGVPALVTDGTVDRQMVLADAYGIAAAGGTIEIASSGQADVQMETVPDDPMSATTVLRSLWQNNETAIKANRFFGAERLGNSVVVLDSVSYDSP